MHTWTITYTYLDGLEEIELEAENILGAIGLFLEEYAIPLHQIIKVECPEQ